MLTSEEYEKYAKMYVLETYLSMKNIVKMISFNHPNTFTIQILARDTHYQIYEYYVNYITIESFYKSLAHGHKKGGKHE